MLSDQESTNENTTNENEEDITMPVQDIERAEQPDEQSETSIVDPDLGNTPEESTQAISDAYVVDPKQAVTSNVVDALQVESEKPFLKRYGLPVLGFLGVLLAVILVSVLTTRDNRENRLIVVGTPAPTPTPTPGDSTGEPSPSPTTYLEGGTTAGTEPTSDRFSEIVQEVLLQFDSSTLEQDLLNPRSPQYRAAVWMADIDAQNSTLESSFPLNDISAMLQFRQRYTLATFYYATNGEQWLNQCNFLTPDLHVCDWKCPWHDIENPSFVNFDYMGITCFESIGTDPLLDQSVVFMEMAFNELSGTLPEELQGLDALFILNLNVNNIGGTIPLEAMTNTLFVKSSSRNPFLIGLTMVSNKLEGTLSPSIGNYTGLTNLYLSDNLLSGSIPSEVGLLNILGVFLADNAFSGQVPPTIYDIPGVLSLSLTNNFLSGPIPEIMAPVPTLEYIFLGGNDLTGPIPESIKLLENLYQLVLSSNELSGTVPSGLGELTALFDLNLEDNQMTGKVLEQPFWYNLTSLRSLVTGNNPFSGSIPPDIGLLSGLVYVDFGHNSSEYRESGGGFTGSLPTEIGLLTNLESLLLSRNNLTGSIPSEIGLLFSTLDLLALNYNYLTGSFPSELALLTKLEIIAINGNQLTGSLDGLCATNATVKSTFHADCNLESVQCSCCTLCCDFADRCQAN